MLDTKDPHADKSLRTHTGFHPETMKRVAELMSDDVLQSTADSIQEYLAKSGSEELLIVTVCRGQDTDRSLDES